MKRGKGGFSLSLVAPVCAEGTLPFPRLLEPWISPKLWEVQDDPGLDALFLDSDKNIKAGKTGAQKKRETSVCASSPRSTEMSKEKDVFLENKKKASCALESGSLGSPGTGG